MWICFCFHLFNDWLICHLKGICFWLKTINWIFTDFQISLNVQSGIPIFVHILNYKCSSLEFLCLNWLMNKLLLNGCFCSKKQRLIEVAAAANKFEFFFSEQTFKQCADQWFSVSSFTILLLCLVLKTFQSITFFIYKKNLCIWASALSLFNSYSWNNILNSHFHVEK